MCNSMRYALDTKIDNVISIICNFIHYTYWKEYHGFFAHRRYTQAREVVGMDTKRKVSTATAVL